ncbi:MAG: hypothetical protein IKO99_12800 [Bacteroidales bacterium]|nr:hypothetical protein [Bacteroidales bacterium]
MTDNIYNPWAGLASYEDPATAERKLKFCGRDDDSYDLARLIMGNVFVTLYGKSGIGKTSLLNAGVFPELREEQYSPDSLRLGIRDEEHPLSYQTMIINAVERVVTRTETVNVIAEQKDQQSTDFLWNYFARHRFYDKNDEPTTPVFVFDQFEEVFRGHRDEAEILLKQLDYLNDKDHALDRCEIDGQTYRYEQNYRFVVSIREDDLYLLEDSIDNCYLPALKRCRYRLRSLTEEGARDAILIPGKGLFNDDDKQPITDAIISKSRNDDGSISTNIVSLLCSRIYVDFKKSGENHISPLLVDNFLKGNPFEKFYNEATRGFSDREKSYIEDNFVDSNGRRNSIPESNFLKNVPNGAALLEGDKRILQRTSTSSDGKNNRVELIHDSFCEPLSRQKEKREKRKRLIQLGLVSLIAILSLSAILYVWNINRQMRINESRVIAEKASALVDEGDSYLARLLALEALPPNRPYTVEAEYALRKASNQNTAILRGHIAEVHSASFSPDGRYIVSASLDGTIKIWDAKTGQHVEKPLEGHTAEVKSALFSPDGKYIVSTSQYDYAVRIWDAKTGQQVGSPLVGHTNYLNSAAFSPDGRYIVSASDDSTARIWDTKTIQQVGEPLKHPNHVYHASFSPDSRYIVTVSDDKAWVWDVETGQQVGEPLESKKEEDRIHDATFSPDGKYIVTALPFSVIFWNTNTRQQVDEYEYEKYIQTVTYSPDGKYIMVSGHNCAMINDTASGYSYKLIGHTADITSVTFSPDSRYIVSASEDHTVRIWDSFSKQYEEIQLQIDGEVPSFDASFSPDGRYVAVRVCRENDIDNFNAYFDVIMIFDVKTGEQVVTDIKFDEQYAVSSIAFSPDDKNIVLAYRQDLLIFDTKTGQQVGDTLKGHTGKVYSASFSPDGRYIVSASMDETVRIWDAKTGQHVGNPLEGHTAEVKSALFSPDGRYIVSTSFDNTIRIWDAKTGEQVGSPLVGHTNFVNSASFSPDGRYIVSASDDKTVRIWDAKTGQQIGNPLEGHTAEVKSALFSPDGKYIVSTSKYDYTVRIWDAKTGLQVDDPLHYEFPITTNFSPDGRHIMSVDEGGTLKILDFPPLQELIDSTRERFKDRPLTPEERKKYYLD